ncbi:ASCH domain-containing protein [Microvirga tunisiensis]|uniref:ASCH domain-containing protein n=1 Tax=Microvirga tunisiensis TaxID=2108360 RepID=A0A5N7MNK9_9HYPH|nr:ASCH domain-containing protein [Microvirga tunisiensis]MPR09857.1 ASCH domain-containing protein [Microvirga tunisiensis]MPR28049.1 ASCH domain-containing protein [Microvirga tunisiensis]
MSENVAFEATMYFRYGRSKRAGVTAETTFDAILRGERTSTTRFWNWPGTDRWARAKPGQLVRFYADKDKSGRSVLVRVTQVREINLSQSSATELEEWSKAEGWSPQAGREFGAKNGRAVWVQYALAGQ